MFASPVGANPHAPFARSPTTIRTRPLSEGSVVASLIGFVGDRRDYPPGSARARVVVRVAARSRALRATGTTLPIRLPLRRRDRSPRWWLRAASARRPAWADGTAGWRRLVCGAAMCPHARLGRTAKPASGSSLAVASPMVTVNARGAGQSHNVELVQLRSLSCVPLTSDDGSGQR